MTRPAQVTVVVNGTEVAPPTRPAETVLELLRDRIGLTGTKLGCGRGECGTCTVLMGDRAVMSCVTLSGLVDGAVTTIEGLADESASLRAAFADRGGLQCGYCTPGQIVRAVALLRTARRAGMALDEQMVRRAMAGNICRCTGYSPIVDAILDAAGVSTHHHRESTR